MKIRLQGNLLFVSATLTFQNQNLTLDRVVLDTGSAGYAPDLDGILGLDFLLRVGAVIDLKNLELRAA